MKIETKKNKRENRHRRIRAKIMGTNKQPRLCVFRSNKYCFVQLIDDIKGSTLCSISDMGLTAEEKKMKPVDRAGIMGKLLANLAIKKGIKNVVFDRGGFLYTGRISALAKGARSGGLNF